MALHQAPPGWTVILVVPVCPESGFRRGTPSRGPLATKWHWSIGLQSEAAADYFLLDLGGAAKNQNL